MATLATIFTVAGVSLPSVASASIITFDFTGRLTVIDPNGNLFNNINNGGWQTPIAATLTYDTNIGVTSSTLNVSIGDWFGVPAYVHDITTSSMTGNIIDAQYLGDWNGNNNMPAHVQWDATGLINAIGYGLQVGDKLSGNSLYRDYNHDHVYDPSELLTANLGSATPYSDTLISGLGIPLQGYAPLAATSASQGFTAGPFTGVVAYFDIGSGNSMYVTSVSTVPVPAAVWLFGSGLLGLIGVARRKAS
ncbi:MAG TPA: VPLPA-CTERM sorting domain-containing protein [Sulfuricaulis sp.]|nr:VPLPA-CTERM sorting domain-containing protein [Sulfuricaulis sp.]